MISEQFIYQRAEGTRKKKFNRNIPLLSHTALYGENVHLPYSVKPRAMSIYKKMNETYNVVWLTNKLKFLCSGVDSHINKFYSAFQNHK